MDKVKRFISNWMFYTVTLLFLGYVCIFGVWLAVCAAKLSIVTPTFTTLEVFRGITALITFFCGVVAAIDTWHS